MHEVVYMKKGFVIILLFFIVTGCGNKIREPESIIVQASSLSEEVPFINVRHFVTNHGNVMVECFVNGISFQHATPEGQKGKIILYIDDKYQSEYHTPAFVVKELHPGTYKWNIQVVDMTGQSLGLEQQFYVTIF